MNSLTQRTGTVASLLGMVSTAANTVTSSFEAIGTGAGMLNTFATEAAKDQADKAKIHRKVYRSNLITQAALEQSKLQLEVQQHLEANPSVTEGFKSVHTELSSLFDETE